MRTRIFSSLAVAGLVLSACGGGGASGAQGEAVDALVKSASAEGIEVDKSCVEDVAKKLSDEDADKIVAAGDEGDFELSAEGEALTNEMISCVEIDSFVDSIIDEIGDEEGVDKDCLREVLGDLNPEELASDGLTEAMFGCIDIGG